MQTFGRCHCGNISLHVTEMPREVSRCNCSICRRYAALWAYYVPGDVVITYQKTVKTFYSWGDQDIEYHRCHICGCVTHYVTTEHCPIQRIALNARMTEPAALEGIATREVDGASF